MEEEAREEAEFLSAMLHYWVLKGKFPLKDTSASNDFASVYGDSRANVQAKYKNIAKKYKRIEKGKEVLNPHYTSSYRLWAAMGGTSAMNLKNPGFYLSQKEPAQPGYPYLSDGLFREINPKNVEEKARKALKSKELEEFETESRSAAIQAVKHFMEVCGVAKKQCEALLNKLDEKPGSEELPSV